MYYPIPIVNTIKWIFPLSSRQTPPPNYLVDSKFAEVNNSLCDHEPQLFNLVTFSQLYTQKYSMLKLE